MAATIPINFKIAHNPATNNIICGSQSRVRQNWSKNTIDCTEQACIAVAEYVSSQKNSSVTIRIGDGAGSMRVIVE
jgi:hypothetical protein